MKEVSVFEFTNRGDSRSIWRTFEMEVKAVPEMILGVGSVIDAPTVKFTSNWAPILLFLR